MPDPTGRPPETEPDLNRSVLEAQPAPPAVSKSLPNVGEGTTAQAVSPPVLPADIRVGNEPYVNPKSLPYVPDKDSSYGPVRRRAPAKSQSMSLLFRPPQMQADDFSELMQEVTPSLIDKALEEQNSSMDLTASASSSAGAKRDREEPDMSRDEPPAHRPRNVDSEVLSVEEVEEAWNQDIQVLIAAHIQKKLSKDIPPTGNPRNCKCSWTSLKEPNGVLLWRRRQ